MMKPLLSIIIPTRNRYYYLNSFLDTIKDYFNNDLIEIIITDNSSQKEDISFFTEKLKNLKYYYIENPISQVENFEFALEKTSGKYITMIGDDDGISRKIIDLVLLMDKKGIEALHTPFVSYYWPGIKPKNNLNEFEGKLFLKNYTFSLSKIDVKSEISKCLRLGGTSLCNLPRLYYGIIKKDVLEKVKISTGLYFPGPSPDMANALSTALYVENAYFFDAPIFIAGNSPNSAAGLGLAGKHIGEIKGNPVLPKDYYLYWSDFIPKYWSGKTIWAETAFQVITKTNKIDLKTFNYYRVFAACLIYYPSHRTLTFESINYYIGKSNKFKTYYNIFLEFFKEWALRFSSLVKNQKKLYFGKSETVHKDIYDIKEATTITEKISFNING